MPVYVKITYEGVEKLKGKVNPKILSHLEERASSVFNEKREGTLKKKLRSLDAQEEEISFIIKCFEKFSGPKGNLNKKLKERPVGKGKNKAASRRYSHSSHLPDIYRSLPRANYKDDT
ncbi:MAG: hypothetical protein ABRQ39_28945 [Candidatus Eremiobacterota bacterium]